MTDYTNTKTDEYEALIKKYYEEKNDKELINLYNSHNDKSSLFLRKLASFCKSSKKSQIPLLIYLESIGINLDYQNQKELLWNFILAHKKKNQYKYIEYLYDSLEFDHPITKKCITIIVDVALDNKTSFKKYDKVLNLLFTKISPETFNWIIDRHKKHKYNEDKNILCTTLEYKYLNTTLETKTQSDVKRKVNKI